MAKRVLDHRTQPFLTTLSVQALLYLRMHSERADLQDTAPRHVVLLPQMQYDRADDHQEWMSKTRISFSTVTSDGSDAVGVALSHIYTKGGDFTGSSGLVGSADKITFGDRDKISHRLEVSLGGLDLLSRWQSR